MWKQLIAELNQDHQFFPPATETNLSEAEKKLGALFPRDLRALLAESNGVLGPIGLGLLWPVDEIAQANLDFRSNEDFRGRFASFDQLLFFGDSGTGDQFAYVLKTDRVQDPAIIEWDHETDRRVGVAATLEEYIRRALKRYA
jgi:hypothetical protein